MTSKIQQTVLLVEDSVPTRKRLYDAVQSSGQFCVQEAVGTVAAAQEELARQTPDILLTDLGLPDGNGRTLIAWVREHAPQTLSMVITVFGDERNVIAALEAGAYGYLLKDEPPGQIAQALQDLWAGGSPVSAPIARHLLRRFHIPPKKEKAPEGTAELSPREHEVLNYVAKGFTRSEIAELMKISTHTVITHVRHIYRKLSVHSRTEAVYEAVTQGLVEL